jgi:AcrR family transcriptional regulator
MSDSKDSKQKAAANDVVDADTETRLLDSAEKLFAQFGYDGTSVRAINEDARVNSGAIHYYFRTKEELLRKVIERRGAILSQERLRRLEVCREEDSRPPLLEQIIYSYIAPYIAPETDEALGSIEQRLYFARLRARRMAESRDTEPVPFSSTYRNTNQRFVDTLAGALPHLSRSEVRLRYLIMWSALNTLSAGLGRSAFGESPDSQHPLKEFESMAPKLIAAFAALFRAPEGEVRMGDLFHGLESK